MTDIEKAEATFKLAHEIAAGGALAAYNYARKRFAESEPYLDRRFTHTEAARKSYIKTVAEGALGCAKSIVADGRAYYYDDHGLITCTLSADASAGPVGYDRR